MSTSSIATTGGAPPAAPRSSGRDRAVALALVLGAQLMIILDMTVVNVALPSIARDLHFSPTGLSWVLNAYTLPFGGLLLLGGRAGDILGRRRVFMAGLALFTVASLAGGLATSAGLLLAARVAQGAGGAVAIPAVLALITSSFPEGRERTRALGLFTAVAMGGASLGLVLGGVIVQWATWRWVLFVNVPIGALGAGARAAVPSETPRQPGTSTPGRGAVPRPPACPRWCTRSSGPPRRAGRTG
jgi:MFS family permease